MTPGRLGLVALAGLTLVACEQQQAPVKQIPVATLQANLIHDAPPGYTVNATATGPMDTNAAAYSTPADVNQTRNELDKQRFAGGYSRVWQHGADYITAAIYGFEKPAGAAAFTAFEAAVIHGEEGSYTYALSVPADGTGFVVTSKNKVQTKTIFCQGGLFALDNYAFIVETCGEQPNSSDTANSLAAAAYAEASVGVLVPGVQPAPAQSPGTSPPPGSPSAAP